MAYFNMQINFLKAYKSRPSHSQRLVQKTRLTDISTSLGRPFPETLLTARCIERSAGMSLIGSA